MSCDSSFQNPAREKEIETELASRAVPRGDKNRNVLLSQICPFLNSTRNHTMRHGQRFQSIEFVEFVSDRKVTDEVVSVVILVWWSTFFEMVWVCSCETVVYCERTEASERTSERRSARTDGLRQQQTANV